MALGIGYIRIACLFSAFRIYPKCIEMHEEAVRCI